MLVTVYIKNKGCVELTTPFSAREKDWFKPDSIRNDTCACLDCAPESIAMNLHTLLNDKDINNSYYATYYLSCLDGEDLESLKNKQVEENGLTINALEEIIFLNA